MVNSPEAPIMPTVPTETNPVTKESAEASEDGSSLMKSIQSFLARFRQPKEQSQEQNKPVTPLTYEDQDVVAKSDETRIGEEDSISGIHADLADKARQEEEREKAEVEAKEEAEVQNNLGQNI